MRCRSDARCLGALLASAAWAGILVPSQSNAQSQTGRDYTKSLVEQYDALRRDHPEIAAPSTNPAAPAMNTQIVRSIMASASNARKQLAISDNTNLNMNTMMDRARGGLSVGVFGPFSGENNNPFMNQGSGSPGLLHEYGKSISNSPRPCSPQVGIAPLFVCSTSSSYPSGHTAKGTGASLLAAYLFPERYHAFLTRGQEYAESRIVAGQHYPLDVMASRAMAYKAVADLLASQVPVANSFLTGVALPTARQGQAAFCGAKTILDCANARTDSFSDHDTNKALYNFTKNYGFPTIGPTDRPMTVPENARYLIRTCFPYLGDDQLRDIIRTTADPSGRVLDDPWSRINLFAAADGYGAFDRDLTVRMDVALATNRLTPGADFFAADTWRNDIGGAGTLTKAGTGILTLAGSNGFAGFDLVEGGLNLTGVNALTGSSRVDGGILTISGHILAVAGDLTTAAGTTVRLGGAGIEAGRALRIDGTLDLAGPAELRIGATATGLVSGVVSGASQLTKSGTGTLTLAGTNGAVAGQFTGRASVEAGTLSVIGTFGDTAANAATVAVGNGATLRGSGTIAGSVTVAAGGTVSAGAATGPSVGTLTVAGDYTLGLGAASAFKLSDPGVGGGTGNDLVRVGGNLTLGGALNLVSALDGGAAPVTDAYRLYDYGGTLAGGFDTIALPTAKTASVYTTIPGQVNILLADAGQVVQIFDGVRTWSSTSTNLSDSPNSQIKDTWRAGVGVFAGAAGTVMVVGAQDLQGLQFTVGGYTLTGSGTLNLTGVPTSTPGQSFVNVDRGVGVAIANTITSTGGAFGLTKVGDGTLTLTGSSTYTGPTVVTAGSLLLAEGARLASAVTTAAAGTFVNAGSLLQGVTNAGTSGNSGTIAGAVDNSGRLTTSGILSGGLANTGAVTASAGRIDGGVANRSGTLAIIGAVSSDGPMSNAVGATVTVAGSGNYDLGGLLTNAGSVRVESGGRLTAFAGIRNEGVFAVDAGATVVDALLNTGRVDNAGSYTADVTNLAGGTLVNTGTLTTVSRPVQNAGFLATSGVLVGGLDNAGIARIGGTLSGALANTGTVLLTAPTTGITALTNTGLLDLGGTTLTVGSFAGTDTNAVLRNGGLVTGGTNVSGTYAGTIADGTGQSFLTKEGSGTLTLTGGGAYSGATTVAAGTLVANGGMGNSPVTVAGGATLGGVGLIGGLAARPGATVAPGATAGIGSLGTLTVAGNVAFARGSVLQIDATADGRADGLVATGTATLQGGTVQVTASPGQYAPRSRYTLLSAASGVTGQFAGAAANFAFLKPLLSYDANAAYLTLARNDLQFGAAAQTRNQRTVATATEALGVGARAYDAVAVLSAAQARQAFDGLSGELHAGAISAEFETAFFVREAILDRMRWGAPPGFAEGADYGRLPAAYAADLP
ncbi:autotransporter-associated beta strand repeat-containing protein, partial [Methylobacterium sp. E-016]|uniref:autotransporter-associated beta strand repeat-containing protein n=1 Tax=Methylobacterium sp. E-016 TaxID=2836556 RepID=UPI001FB8935E